MTTSKKVLDKIDNYRRLNMVGASLYNVVYYLYNSKLLKKSTGSKTLRREEVTTDFLDKNSSPEKKLLNSGGSSTKLAGDKPVFKFEGVCFAGLADYMARYGKDKGVKIDSMAYKLIQDAKKGTVLTKETESKWLKNCVKVGYLPRSTKIKEIIDKRLYIINPCVYNGPLLYIYLCSVRNITEEPYLVLFCMELVEKLGYEFEVAFSIAEELLRVNVGHSFTNFRYGSGQLSNMKVKGAFNAAKIRSYINKQLSDIKDKKNTIGYAKTEKPAGISSRLFNVSSYISNTPIKTGDAKQVVNTFSLNELKHKEVNNTFRELKRVNKL